MSAIPFYKSVYETRFLAGDSGRSRGLDHRAMPGAPVSYRLRTEDMFVFWFLGSMTICLVTFNLRYSQCKIYLFQPKFTSKVLIYWSLLCDLIWTSQSCQVLISLRTFKIASVSIKRQLVLKSHCLLTWSRPTQLYEQDQNSPSPILAKEDEIPRSMRKKNIDK